MDPRVASIARCPWALISIADCYAAYLTHSRHSQLAFNTSRAGVAWPFPNGTLTSLLRTLTRTLTGRFAHRRNRIDLASFTPQMGPKTDEGTLSPG